MSSKPDRASIYGIHRVDDDAKRQHCWVVHIQRRRRILKRMFSDRVHGGKAKALRAARAFRNGVLASHPPMNRADYAAIKRKNNRSGTPGVIRYVAAEVGQAGVVEKAYWIAFWSMPEGKQARRKFSINKYGERAAHSRAKATRKQALASMVGVMAHTGLKHWLRRHAQASARQ